MNNEGPTTTAIYGNNSSAPINANTTAPIDEDILGLVSPLTIAKNIIDTGVENYFQTEAQIQNIVGNNRKNTVFLQGTTKGWTNVKEWVLGIPIALQGITNGPPSGNFPDNATDLLSDWVQGEFCMLFPIKMIEVRIGANNQIVQNQTMNFGPHMKLIAQCGRYNWAERIALAELGLPYSIMVSDYINLRSNYQSATAIYEQCKRSSISFEYFNAYNRYKYLLADSNYNVAPINTEIGLPLSCINSFFQQDAFLPPGVNFRIQMDYTVGPQVIATNSSYNLPIGGLETNASDMSITYFPLATTSAYAQPQNLFLIMRSHILHAALQNKINNMWLKQPFLYNIDSYEPVDILMDGMNTTFSRDMSITRQRPTMLIFKMSFINSVISPQLFPLMGYNLVNGLGFPNSSFPAYWGNVFIYIGGKQAYFFRGNATSVSNTYFAPVPQGSAVIENMIAHSTTYNNENEQSPLLMPAQGLGQPFIVTINPGDLEKRGLLSADDNAIQIKVTFQTLVAASPGGISGGLGPWPNTCRCIIYKKYPEQYQLDAQKNMNRIADPLNILSSGFKEGESY